MKRPSLFRLLSVVFVALALTLPAAGSDVDRLVMLARVWATVKYLHPFVMQKQIDWDQALVRAVPKVHAATSDDDFAEAVGSMLKELGDPATRVLQRKASPRPGSDPALLRWESDALVISAGPYADAKGGMALVGELSALAKEITKARQVVIDLRDRPANPDERGMAAYVVSELRGLISKPVTTPATVSVYHSGYRPQLGTTSGGYFSGLLTVPGESFVPVAGAAAPSRVVFVTDADSIVPSVALALRSAGQAVIVSEAPIGDHVFVNTKSLDLGGNWRALVRLQTIGVSVAADLIAADPMTDALAIATGKKPLPNAPHETAAANVVEPRWRPDPDYKDMVYPDLAHRLVAAIRIWSVIEYFYPYKALIGDWDKALAESIPQFVSAANEDEYAAAVLQMVARVEDGHSVASGHPGVARLLGTWRMPIEVRRVENEFVVTALRNPLPPETDVLVGDVVVSVDGEPMRTRIERLRRYVTASTDTARINRVAGFALMGPPESTATLMLQGADRRTRTVHIKRAQAVQPRETGEPYRLLDKTIGFVDLKRLTVPQVDPMFDALKNTGAIIFDMRGYPNGTAWSIAPRINTKGARVGAIFRRAQISGVATFEETASGFFFEQPLPVTDTPKYTGRTIMLVDDRAISQSEHTALFFEAANDTTFIGTPTAGANGDVTNFSLPGGFRVNFSGHDVRHADGRQLQRVGIQPQVAVAPTIAGLRAGRDEILERAVAVAKQGTREPQR
jgi:C-terminal processing protease CtpA/Prc